MLVSPLLPLSNILVLCVKAGKTYSFIKKKKIDNIKKAGTDELCAANNFLKYMDFLKHTSLFDGKGFVRQKTQDINNSMCYFDIQDKLTSFTRLQCDVFFKRNLRVEVLIYT